MACKKPWYSIYDLSNDCERCSYKIIGEPPKYSKGSKADEEIKIDDNIKNFINSCKKTSDTALFDNEY